MSIFGGQLLLKHRYLYPAQDSLNLVFVRFNNLVLFVFLKSPNLLLSILVWLFLQNQKVNVFIIIIIDFRLFVDFDTASETTQNQNRRVE